MILEGKFFLQCPRLEDSSIDLAISRDVAKCDTSDVPQPNTNKSGIIVLVQECETTRRQASLSSTYTSSSPLTEMSPMQPEISQEGCGKTGGGGRFAAGSSRSEFDVILSYTKFYEGTQTRSWATVNDRLFGNSEVCLPTRDDLEYLQGITMKEILFSVYALLESTATAYEGTQEIHTSVACLPFFEICKTVYGVGNKADLLIIFGDLQFQSPISLGVFLRALIGAAVYEWVFDGCHDSPLNDLDSRTGIPARFMSEIEKREWPLTAIHI